MAWSRVEEVLRDFATVTQRRTIPEMNCKNRDLWWSFRRFPYCLLLLTRNSRSLLLRCFVYAGQMAVGHRSRDLKLQGLGCSWFMVLGFMVLGFKI